VHLLLTAAVLTAVPTKNLDAAYSDLEALYKDLHQSPELSKQEQKTSAKLAAKLKALGFTVTSGIGGYGLVGVLKNGPGPTLLLRTDLDALPVEEKTGLPYASKVTAIDPTGAKVPVMHACGHDMHMTVWTGTATVLSQLKDQWHGTLVMLGQPAEEGGNGALAMIHDKLFERIPRPDYAVALHVKGEIPAGQVGVIKGYAFANVDSVDITFFGRGGHGAAPQTTIDPIPMAARAVGAFQTLISREQNPFEPAVVTVGSFHAGTKHNIISDEAKLQLTLRSYTPEVRKALVDGVTRIAKAEALAARAPKEPLVQVAEGAPAVYNDPALTGRLTETVKAELGEGNVIEVDRIMGAEDFSEYSREGGFPSSMLWLGSVEASKYQASKNGGPPLPSTHSALYQPDREKTLRTGVRTLVAVALDLLKK
jgi:hippurate hydrolase